MAGAVSSIQKTLDRKAGAPEMAPRCFIKLTDVRRLTALSTSEIYRRIAAGAFPDRIMLGPRSAVWVEAEVLAWCDERIAGRDRDATK
jgi:prophage regulatory protein